MTESSLWSRWTTVGRSSARLAAALLGGLVAVQAIASASAAQDVLWRGSLPRRPDAGEDIVMTTPAGGAVRVSLRARQSGAAPLPPLPLATDILAGVEAEPFGSERRCTFERGGKVTTLRCRAGSSVAGFVFPFSGTRLPSGVPLQLLVESRGSTRFEVQVTAKGEDAKALRLLRPAVTPLPLPPLGERAEPQLVVIAPAEGGEVVLSSGNIVPSPVVPRLTDASAWAWEPERWRDSPAQTLAAAGRKG